MRFSAALSLRLPILLCWSAGWFAVAQPYAPAPGAAADPTGAASPAALPQPNQPASQPVPPAESVALPPVPARPVSHVLDESGMFTEAEAKALSARLLSSQTRTGLGLYLSIHTYLADETVDTRARRTHAAWLAEGKGSGIIVVHERGSGRVSFAGSDDSRMPKADGLRALYRLADATARALPPEAAPSTRLAATMTSLADGLESWQKNGRLPAMPVVAAPPRAAATGPAVPPVQPPWTRPDVFLVDEAGTFQNAPEAAALASRLKAWHEETGLSLYVVTVTFPPQESGIGLAEKLVEEWLPGSMGGVIVFDRSRPDVVSFAGTPQADRWLTPVRLGSLHESAAAAGRATGPDPAGRLTAAADYLMDAYAKEGLPILRESQQWLPRTQRQYLPWILGGVAGFAALLYGFQRWQERADRRRSTVFTFPEVYVPERLGAPQGGGVAAELSAGPDPGRQA